MPQSKKRYYASHGREEFHEDILRHFSGKDPVLDLGCGIGWLGMHRPGMYGVDNDPGAIKRAVMYEKAQVCDVDGTLPFKDGFFGGVIAKDILEHGSDPVKMIHEIRRILKKGGLILITTQMPHGRFWDDYTHKRPFTRKSLTGLLEDNGFTVRETWYTGNWPGLGIIAKTFGLKQTPAIFKKLTEIGINRNNICAIATKG
jgi:SAM-dependent methyltransferase